jgi:uroporphyrinogen decarboxylase
LGHEQYQEFGMKYIKQIVEAFEVPFTVFSKGAYSSLENLMNLSCTTIGLDWNMNMDYARGLCGENKTLQGNLDPCVLYGSHHRIESETLNMLKAFKSHRHIVNLGHGVYPDIHPENVKTFIKTVKHYEI